MGGAIYKDSRDTLTRLGLDKPTARRLLEKINIYAANQAHAIISIRRQKEAQARKKKGMPGAWGAKQTRIGNHRKRKKKKKPG